MKLILLSGGSGKRLWPLSNDARSKQFLKVLESKNGNLQSMVQRVWEQLTKIGLSESTYVATSKSQVDIIQNQIGRKDNLVVEPSRRDTFPAISLVSSYLYSVEKMNLNEVVVVLPVDPYVEDDFFEKIKNLENVINQSQADIGLIGVKPTSPSSKYGYIIPKNDLVDKDYFEVKNFIEKPNENEAKNLIDIGALWNCGVFSFRLSFIINLLEEKGFPTNYEDLILQYEKLPKTSFDYEVLERVNNIIALSYNGYWKDLGTWDALTEEMSTSQIGVGTISRDSNNSHLLNELDIPIILLGVNNLVVAASPDGILISDKAKSPSIKELVGDYNNRPMYEERRWGWYRVLDFTKTDEGNEVLTKRICIKAGKNLSYHYHNDRSETWTIIKGEGIFAHNEKLCFVKPGDVLKINEMDKHGLKALTDLELIEIQAGSQLIEDDIARLYLTWEEIEEQCYFLTK